MNECKAIEKNNYFFIFFSHDQLVMIADRIVNEADKTEDGSICFEEFQEALADLDFEGKMAFVSFS